MVTQESLRYREVHRRYRGTLYSVDCPGFSGCMSGTVNSSHSGAQEARGRTGGSLMSLR